MASMSRSVAKPVRRWRSDPISRLWTLTPFALAIYADFLAPRFFGGGITRPPEIMGISAGAWLQIAFLAWAGVGAWIVWTTHSFLKSAASLVLFTTVALFGIWFGPALILIAQNLGS